jgi:hypothetical protein
MNRTAIAAILFVLTCVPPASVLGQVQERAEPNRVRIGIYDSRAIAIAWAGSRFNPVDAKMKEYQAAKDSNDAKKIAELEAWGPAHQRLLHIQGFGRVPVGELLLPVQEKLKTLISEQNLVAITMHCDQIAESVQLVDITMELVQFYDPSEKTIEWVKQLRDQEPLSLLELAQLPVDK